MTERFARTESLIGAEAVKTLAGKRVAVFGIGGVGSYALEAIVRAGIGAVDIIDNDVISESNINRQLIATCETVGLAKTDAAKARIKSINPDCRVTAHQLFFLPETAGEIDFKVFDYVVDAVDTVTAKLTIIEKAAEAQVPVISCMGTGDKLDPTAFTVCDIYATEGDALARVMRRECRKRNIKSLKVVYSKEESVTTIHETEQENAPGRRHTPGSVSFVPPVAGMIMAAEVIKDLIKEI